MSIKLITAPTTYPVTLAEAKLHCRVDASDEDALITALITAATEMAEQKTGRALMTQTWLLKLDAFPDAFELTRVPVQTITSLQYIDSTGATVVLSTGSNYRLSDWDESGFAKVVPVAGYEWPTTKEDTDVVSLEYVAGYASAGAVPQSIKQWILLMISTMYESREAETTGNGQVQTHEFVDRLLDRYMVSEL